MAYLGRKGAAAALTSADIPDDSITSAKIVDATVAAGDLAANSVDSSELVDGSVDLSHMSANSVDSNQYVDGSIDTIHVADNQITLAKMAGGTDGKIITYDASGDPALVGPGADGEVLTSTGAGSPPAFEAAAGGGPVLVWAGWNSDATYSNFSGSAPTASGGGGDERSIYYYTMPLQTTATGITLNTDYLTKGTFGTNEPNTQTSYTGKDTGGAYFTVVTAGVYMFYVEGATYMEDTNNTRHRCRKTPEGTSTYSAIITVFGTVQIIGDDFTSGHHWVPFNYSGAVDLEVDDKLHFDAVSDGATLVWNDTTTRHGHSGKLELWFMNT